jgi:LPS sulfotransferase NodH
VRQKLCRRTTKSMTDATADIGVEQARGWANKLIAAHHRGPGDTVDAAIHRAAVKHGLDPKSLWRLRYRTPKDMLLSTWARIKEAYEAECERQEARLRHELEITKALPATEARLRLIRETEAVLGSLASEDHRQPAE